MMKGNEILVKKVSTKKELHKTCVLKLILPKLYKNIENL